MEPNRTTPESTQKASNCLDSNRSEYDLFIGDRRDGLLDRLKEACKKAAERFSKFSDGGIILPHKENPFLPSLPHGEYIITTQPDSSDNLYFQYWKEWRESDYFRCDGEWVWHED